MASQPDHTSLGPPPVVVRLDDKRLFLARCAFVAEQNAVRIVGSYVESQKRRSVAAQVAFTSGATSLREIAPAILGASVGVVGISRDGRFVYGSMESTFSASGAAEGFVAPFDDLSDRTFIGFLPDGKRASCVCDLSANGIAVGYAAGPESPQRRATPRAIRWSRETGLFPLATPTTGYSKAMGISADGKKIVGCCAVPEQGIRATHWMSRSRLVIATRKQAGLTGCSPNGDIVFGEESTVALIRQGNRPCFLYQEPGYDLRGNPIDATDSGFVVGHAILRIANNRSGFFNTDRLGFLWHTSWIGHRFAPLTIRQYVQTRTGVDIGFDVRRATGISEHDGMLYLAGDTEVGGVVIKVIAQP